MPSIEDWEIIDPHGLIYNYIVNMGEPEMSQHEGSVEVSGLNKPKANRHISPRVTCTLLLSRGTSLNQLPLSLSTRKKSNLPKSIS